MLFFISLGMSGWLSMASQSIPTSTDRGVLSPLKGFLEIYTIMPLVEKYNDSLLCFVLSQADNFHMHFLVRANHLIIVDSKLEFSMPSCMCTANWKRFRFQDFDGHLVKSKFSF